MTTFVPDRQGILVSWVTKEQSWIRAPVVAPSYSSDNLLLMSLYNSLQIFFNLFVTSVPFSNVRLFFSDQ